MLAHICDRCGETYTQNKLPTFERIDNGLLGGFNFVSIRESVDSHVDLCDICMSDLIDFVNNKTVYKREKVIAE